MTLRRAGLAPAVALWLLARCGHEAPASRPPTPVRTQAVVPAGGEPEVRYSANIEPHAQATLSFRVGGYIERILERRGADGRPRPVQQGDMVERGAVLARLRESDYREKVRMARAQLAEAEAALNKTRADLARADDLLESRSLTRQDHDTARASHDASLARTEAAAGRVQEAELALKDCALHAPFTGILLAREIDLGELAVPGAPAFVVADLTTVKAVFGVPDSILSGLKPGDTLPVRTVSPENLDLRGTITSVSPSADLSSRVFDVEVSIPNPGGALKPGMIVTVPVPGSVAGRPGADEPPAMAPIGAIVRSPANPDGYAVFVVEGDGPATVARAREVTLGEVRGNYIQILSGVAAGDRVIVGGASFLVDGEAIAVIP